jgi:hypothetical protein
VPTKKTTAHAVIRNVQGNTFELRNPHGKFVCQGPLDFLIRQSAANGWEHVCR